MRQIGIELLYVLEALYNQVTVGSIDPFGLCIYLEKIHKFFIKFFVAN